jgi:rubrerythrin
MLNRPKLRSAVELAVTTEKLGAGFYQTVAEKHEKDCEINELFSMLAKDEKLHESQFKALLDKIPADEEEKGSEEKYQYLAAAAMSQFFLDEKGPMKDIDEVRTRDAALARAFALEKATLFYYHALRDVFGENEILMEVIEAEKSHLVSVMKYLITGAKMRGLSDNW